MQRVKSLSTRLVVAVVATAAIAFTVSAGLTLWRLDAGIERQAAQLARLSEEKLRQKLDGEARLARARVERLLVDVGRRLESVTQRAEIVKAVASRNGVSIGELLGRAARSAELDGIVVVDSKLAALAVETGSQNTGQTARGDATDLAAVSQALARHPLGALVGAIISENDRARPRTLRLAIELNAEAAKALGSATTSPLAMIVAEPVFDDAGGVVAGVIGYRNLRRHEPTLAEFSGLEGAGVMILAGREPVSAAGISNPDVSMNIASGAALSQTSDGSYWGRCNDLFEAWRLCALAPVNELHALRDELVRIGESEGRSLALWLSLFAVLSLVLFAAITFFTARHISRPLALITNAVRAVARGDWKSEVAGLTRKDEIGDIARAVAVLQRSLEERDRLRSDVAHAEAIKKRRAEMEDAIRRFDRVMRSVLLSVSDCVETMDETAREIARMSGVAEGEAAEAAFVSEKTVTNVSTLRSATERLSVSISETADQIRQTADILATSSTVAQTASSKAKTLARNAAGIDVVMRVVDDLAAQINTVALNATLKGAQNAAPGEAAQVLSDIKTLADRVAQANGQISGQIATIRGATDDTVGDVQQLAQRLDLVLQQTRAIAAAMERQDLVTREIAGNMVSAANGTMNVSSSVERLKATIEEARGASMKVVTKASDMADEAHRLDSTVKSFLREVNA